MQNVVPIDCCKQRFPLIQLFFIILSELRPIGLNYIKPQGSLSIVGDFAKFRSIVITLLNKLIHGLFRGSTLVRKFGKNKYFAVTSIKKSRSKPIQNAKRITLELHEFSQ
jgi:hypothetical protein